MKEKELRIWLASKSPSRLEKRGTIDWIIKALKSINRTIDTASWDADSKLPTNLREILYLVAYGTPLIPYETRREKVYLFNDDDDEFFTLKDKEWREFWQRNRSDYFKKEYLIPQ